MRTLATLFAVLWKLAAVLLVYNLLLFVLRPVAHLDLDAGTENLIIAERYLYGPAPAAVVVGSSMGRTLTEFLPANFYNLSFSGYSSVTGAEIVLRGALRPRIVVIETNVMDRSRNQAMVGQVFAEPHFSLHRYVPSLRYEYRPALLLVNTEHLHPDFSLSAFSAAALPALPAVDIGLPPPSMREDDDPRLAAGLATQMAHDAAVDAAERARIAAATRDMAAQVNELRARGVCVLLLRLPIHPQADASPLERYQAEAVRAALPPGDYSWIEIKDEASYHTVDGIHMTDPSARRVAWIVANRASQILRGAQSCAPAGP